MNWIKIELNKILFVWQKFETKKWLNMPKIFALRDRLMEVQQSLFSHEENERTKGNSDNNFSSSSSKLFGLNLLHFDSMFDQPPMTSSFHIEHKHLTPEEGKIGTPKTYVHTSILNTPKNGIGPSIHFKTVF